MKLRGFVPNAAECCRQILHVGPDRCFFLTDLIQLRVEVLLADPGLSEQPEDPVTLSFELLERGVRTRVGPLRDTALAGALQGPPPGPGELTLPRILATVVDSYGVEDAAEGRLVVRLEKAVRG